MPVQVAKNSTSAGARFRAALAAENPLQVVGAVNAYSALLAERAGFNALYLSGAGVANASFGLPDLGITSLNDVWRTSAASPPPPTCRCWSMPTRAGARRSTSPAPSPT